jgi:hypothetical protein
MSAQSLDDDVVDELDDVDDDVVDDDPDESEDVLDELVELVALEEDVDLLDEPPRLSFL